eukprot:CAMPEP_0185411334 /NCGR_PEP_ID=MMETSP1365-20130426/3525_1 /TAXON_ID=38817 /ORGANISM="Gephyrocapsa oceanica, Strain RCC1303" /LENGTH=43 /DNA_ID= /DNA_START= /DNA_END= /DNA_ORIENTATION=
MGWLQGQGGVALVTHVPSAFQLDSFDESHRWQLFWNSVRPVVD